MRRIAFPTVLFLFLSSLAFAAEPLPRKEGLWSVHSESKGPFEQSRSEATYKLCRSHAYDSYELAQEKQRFVTTSAGFKCQTTTDSLTGSTYTLAGGCNGGPDASYHGTLTITVMGETSAQVKSRRMNSTVGGLRIFEQTSDESYVGMCPAGMQPGDRMDPDGKVTHLWKH